ncbi:hypothetical protein D3C80_1456130 [compost metagenome]
MINANRLIAEADETIGNCACLRKTLVGIRKAVLVDQPLIGTTLRQVCITEAGDAIRLELSDPLAGLTQRLNRLQRQTIDKVKV